MFTNTAHRAADAAVAASQVAAFLASGRQITVCPDRFAAPSQAGASRNPFRR